MRDKIIQMQHKTLNEIISDINALISCANCDAALLPDTSIAKDINRMATSVSKKVRDLQNDIEHIIKNNQKPKY